MMIKKHKGRYKKINELTYRSRCEMCFDKIVNGPSRIPKSPINAYQGFHVSN